jgi:hypothetical protein
VIALLALWLAVFPHQTRDDSAAVRAAFDKAPAWTEFLAGVKAQRERWTANTARATVPPALAARFAAVAHGLRLLIVAQDWCLDSVNTVPYIARLAASAGVPVHVVDRAAGESLMKRYPARDGRMVTPVVILLRDDRVVGAWVERPAPLQQAFEAMGTSPDALRRFNDRQAWYDEDAGRTTLDEIITLAEKGPALLAGQR